MFKETTPYSKTKAENSDLSEVSNTSACIIN